MVSIVAHAGGSIDAPDGWVAESMLTLRAPGPLPQPNLVLTRHARTTLPPVVKGPGREEAALAERVRALGAVLAISVDGVRERTVAGQRALDASIHWREASGPMFHRIAVFFDGEGELHVLAGTATAAAESVLATAFERALASLRPRAVIPDVTPRASYAARR